MYFEKGTKRLKKETEFLFKKNDTNAKHPQMFTYKMTVVPAEEARDGGRTKSS